MADSVSDWGQLRYVPDDGCHLGDRCRLRCSFHAHILELAERAKASRHLVVVVQWAIDVNAQAEEDCGTESRCEDSQIDIDRQQAPGTGRSGCVSATHLQLELYQWI